MTSRDPKGQFVNPVRSESNITKAAEDAMQQLSLFYYTYSLTCFTY